MILSIHINKNLKYILKFICLRKIKVRKIRMWILPTLFLIFTIFDVLYQNSISIMFTLSIIFSSLLGILIGIVRSHFIKVIINKHTKEGFYSNSILGVLVTISILALKFAIKFAFKSANYESINLLTTLLLCVSCSTMFARRYIILTKYFNLIKITSS